MVDFRFISKIMSMNTGFVAYLPNFYLGDSAVLVAVDDAAIGWLMAQFQLLASASPAVRSAFVVGDGQPISSDGRCLLKVTRDDTGGTRLVRTKSSELCWEVSRA